MLTLPKLSDILFRELHNSTFRLCDDATQLSKVKKIAAMVLRTERSQVNTSVADFKCQWLNFLENSKTERKTRAFRVYNKVSGVLLGEIRWSGQFRAYSFFPAAGVCFSLLDLADIQEFVELLMHEREKNQDKVKFAGEKDVLK